MMLSFVQQVCVAALPIIFAITVHEAAHGYVASKLGDQTARLMGRVSLNPAKHIDPFGTVILPLLMLALGGFIFGWAKPVPITWRNLKNPRRDMALVAAAGPGANLMMAFLWGIIAKINTSFLLTHSQLGTMGFSITQFVHLTAQFGIMINCVLLVINMIPIPPLDGSRVASSLLPAPLARKYNRLEMYGMWIFLGILFLLLFTNAMYVIQIPIEGLMHWIYTVLGLNVML